MQKRLLFSIALLGVLVASVVHAAEAPITVSPGETSKMTQVESRCPTFSWGSVAGARRYELVVYRLERDSSEAESVLTRSFPGSVGTWTPSLVTCLEPGGRYAWSVRAVRRSKEVSDWSIPSLFQVAAGPNEVEFEAALEVVRSYLATQEGAVFVGKEAGEAGEGDPAAKPVAEPPVSAGGPVSRVASATAMKVDLGVEAASFTGDGSTLTNLDPVNLAPGTAAIDIGGTAATASGLSCSGCVSFDELDSSLGQRVTDLEASMKMLTDHITVSGDDLTITTPGEAGTITITAPLGITISSELTLNISSDVALDISAGAALNLEAAALTTLKGGIIVMNDGTRPVSGIGHGCVGTTGSPGGTSYCEIALGSGTILID